MLHAKNRTLVTTLATLSLMGMPIVAYADPAGGETPRNDAEMASPAPEAVTSRGLASPGRGSRSTNVGEYRRYPNPR